MEIYAKVIIDIALEKLDRVFDYRVPATLQGQVTAGSLVRVPFGRSNREVRGYVSALSDSAVFPAEEIKEIAGLEPVSPLLSQLIALADWMKRRYGGTGAQALRTVLPVRKGVTPKTHRELVLVISPEEAAALADECAAWHRNAMERLLRTLAEQPVIPYAFLKKMGISGSTVNALVRKGALEVRETEVYRDPLGEDIRRQTAESIESLTAEQKQALIELRAEQGGEGRPCLLFGITGSGKTEVYLQRIEDMIREGKQTILLIPEIALTYQMLIRFYSRFKDRVSVIHSRLSAGERADQFSRAAKGEIDVMIGPRSALFTPFPNLGLIIVDEEHESSYISEKTPCYHSVETAVERGRLAGAQVILGSATPSMESFEHAKDGDYRLIRMSKRAREGSRLPEVHIVDLREELKRGNRSMFSADLHEAISSRLERGEQIMLFLNRRGYSGLVSCRSCGTPMKCPHCDVALTLHRGNVLRCHYCGYRQPMPGKCPSCGSPYLAGFGIGTQKVESALKDTFPGARVLRMDADTTGRKHDHEKILGAFAEGRADILLGTQMIVKGHDFPRVSLVGILAADLSLYSPDFRASERTFSLLTQASGRAGRAEVPGEVIIQSYDPEHYAITLAATQDYESFFERERQYRRLLRYPPVSAFWEVMFSHEDRGAAERAAEYVSGAVRAHFAAEGWELTGPGEASISRIKDIYRFVFYLRGKPDADAEEVIRVLEDARKACDSPALMQIRTN